MRTFRFGTGVKASFNRIPNTEIDSNGVQYFTFDCENVPEGSTFLYACDSPDLEIGNASVIVREIHNSHLLSKYAYFRTKG